MDQILKSDDNETKYNISSYPSSLTYSQMEVASQKLFIVHLKVDWTDAWTDWILLTRLVLLEHLVVQIIALINLPHQQVLAFEFHFGSF